MPYNSNRKQFMGEVERGLTRNIKQCAIYLVSAIKADISQEGILRYSTGKRGQKTVYNFTHSRPGNPPFKQKGTLRNSIAWEMGGFLTAKVGSNIKSPKYPLYLEKGTRKMKKRPYLVANLIKHKGTLVMIMTRKIPGSGLPPISSNQFRSSHYGSGARKAGYA